MHENVIEIRNLTRVFGTQKAVDDVSLFIPRGAVFGLVGENGAGKTTIIKHILGLLVAKSGSVSVFGRDPALDPVSVLSRIGYLSEDRDLPDWMRISELMRYTQAFYPSWDQNYADELCRLFELDSAQKIGTLSRGQRALAGLLVAQGHRPELLLLDEPSSGLDPIVRRNILAAIIRTVGDEGRTVLFSSHLLDEVERVADRVAMIDQGRIALCDDVENIVSVHRRVMLRFREPRDAAPQLPGGLAWTGAGRDWSCICNGKFEELRDHAALMGADVIEVAAASLDEIFVARVKG